MKKLFTAIFLLASMSAFAQGGRIRIVNNSNCTVYYQIIVSVMSLTPTCAPGGTSSIIPIAPGTNVVYSGSGSGVTAIPGVTVTPAYILAARVFDGPPSCITTSVNVGEPCTGLPVTGIINEKTATCTPCSVIKINWTPSSPTVGGTCTLTFS